MKIFLIILAFFQVFYAYFGYPIALFLLNMTGCKVNKRKRNYSYDIKATITIIITVHNEDRVIEEKLENTLSLKYGDSVLTPEDVQIIVASDCSIDRTDNIVMCYQDRGVELIRLKERKGKEFAQKEAIDQSRGEIILFTDAKIKLEEDALNNLLYYFADEQVGVVSSVDRVEGGSGEGFYVKYEMFLRSLESKFNTLIGLSGSCFAARKEIATELRTDIPSDFSQLLIAVSKGLVGVHAPNIVGSYQAVESESAEFKRKVRTVLRGITTFFSSFLSLRPLENKIFTWQLISHKLCRWLVPFCFLFATILSIFSIFEGGLLSILGISSLVFYLLAVLGFYNDEAGKSILCRIPLFFLLVNTGILVAWIKYFSGERSVQWTPSNKGKA